MQKAKAHLGTAVIPVAIRRVPAGHPVNPTLQQGSDQRQRACREQQRPCREQAHAPQAHAEPAAFYDSRSCCELFTFGMIKSERRQEGRHPSVRCHGNHPCRPCRRAHLHRFLSCGGGPSRHTCPLWSWNRARGCDRHTYFLCQCRMLYECVI